MKRILSFTIALLSYVGLSSQNYDLQISKEGNSPDAQLVVKIAYVGPGMAPKTTDGDGFVDLVVSIKLGSITSGGQVTLGAAIDGIVDMIKNGSVKSSPSGFYQDFSINTPGPPNVNMVTGNYYELFRVDYDGLTIPVVAGNATIAPSSTPGDGIPDAFVNYEFIEFNPTTSGAAPLPIKLTSFFAEKNGETAVKLDWISKSEVNASHYEVERSVNNISNFEKIGEVKAAGNSSTEIKYDFIDNNLPFSRDNQHTFYYRLNQVDIDGFAEYSDIRSVTFTDDLTVKVTTYPNPASSSIFVDMSSKSAKEDAKLYLIDASGKLVTSRTISANGVSEIEVSQYLNGIYDIMIQHDGKVYNQKVIKTN